MHPSSGAHPRSPSPMSPGFGAAPRFVVPPLYIPPSSPTQHGGMQTPFSPMMPFSPYLMSPYAASAMSMSMKSPGPAMAPQVEGELPPLPTSSVTTHDFTTKTSSATIERFTKVDVYDKPLLGPPAAEVYITGIRKNGTMMAGGRADPLDPKELLSAPIIRLSHRDTNDPKALGPLRRSRYEKLLNVFHRYDFDSDGFVDVNDMRLLGWALSAQQRLPTVEETILQLGKADRDADGRLSQEEFMLYSSSLAKMIDEQFDALMALLIAGHETALSTGFAAQVHSGAS